MNFRGWSAVCTAATGSAVALVGCAGQPAALINGLRAPHAWVADVGPDAAVRVLTGALLWLIALWTALALSATALSLLPGRFGLLADTVARRVSPAVLRRVVVAAAGTSILISPVAASADPGAAHAPAPTGNSAGRTAASVIAVPLPMDRPADQPSSQPASDPQPSASARSQSPQSQSPQSQSPQSQSPRSQSPSGRVIVRPGDSLWTIAAQRLGKAPSAARVQADWPRWYAANRQLIGGDPNLLQPGTSLQAPKLAASGAGE